MNLPKSTQDGVIINWTSNNPSIINENGKVTRPSAANGDVSLTLTATLIKGEAKETKDFIVTIKAKDFTDEEIVNIALKNLELKGNLNNVVDNINLPTSDDKNTVTVTWKSSNEAIVSNDGKVSRTDKDENVTLTATLAKGSVSKTKDFKIVVKAKEKDIQESLKLIADSLEINNKDNIENDIKLPTSLDGVNIKWESSDESVINNEGKVTRPEYGSEDSKITLTATITKDGKSVTKEFNVTVKAEKELVANNKEEFYNILKNSLENFKSKIQIKVPNYNEEDYNLEMINRIVLEHPEIDYGYKSVSGKCRGYENQQEKTLNLNIEYRLSKDDMKREKDEVKDKVKQIIDSETNSSMSDVEKELALHDYIVKNARYDVEHVKDDPVLPEDHNAYGVLVNGVGVCESYAKAMSELLNTAGIECKYVTGYSKHNGVKGGAHGWNMVKLDNEWYNLDTTWDDPVSDRNGASTMNSDNNMMVVNHSYFNVTDEVLNKDHVRGDFEKSNYPSCTSTKYSYENLDIKEYTTDGKLIETLKSKEELDNRILKALNSKEENLVLRIKGFKMSQHELSHEVEIVANNNNLRGFRWSTSKIDDCHVQYTLTWQK